MVEPRIDVIVATHTPLRPVERAVASALADREVSVRVTVVIHNTDEGPVRERLSSFAGDERLRVFVLRDGVRSPAGPMNLGLSEASGEFTSVIGSDDEFEVGALAGWLRLADRLGADCVIARCRTSLGQWISEPPVRFRRRGVLDPVRDRVVHRQAPLGLVRRERFGDLRFATGVPSGEDQLYVARIWGAGAPIVFAADEPCYIIHVDGDDKSSSFPADMRTEYSYFFDLLDDADVRAQGLGLRRTLAARLYSSNVCESLLYRVRELPASVDWDFLAGLLRALEEFAPGYTRLLTWANTVFIARVLRGDRGQDLMGRAVRQKKYLLPGSWPVPRNPLRVFEVNSPFRMLAAKALRSLNLS